MFNDWKKRRELRREIELIKKRYALKFDTAEPSKVYRLQDELNKELATPTEKLELLLSKPLFNKAYRMGISVPGDSEFWNYTSGGLTPTRTSLTERGRILVGKMIKEERRKNVEWWVKVFAPLLTLIVSILGLLVALTSLFLNRK